MATGFTPNKWGPQLTSKDYEFMMEGANCATTKISLLEHALTSPSQELSDPVTAPVQKIVRGKIQTTNQTVKPGEQTSLSYTLLFPSSLWTPALERARKGAGCKTNFFAKYLCPPESQYRHAWIYPDAILDPPSEVEDFITNTTDTVILTEQTTLRVTERLFLPMLQYVRQADIANAVHAIAFMLADCVGCDDSVWTRLVAANADGTAVPNSMRTSDRFANTTEAALTGIVPAASEVTDIYTSGNTVLISFADAPIASGTIGGTAISFDGGATWTVDANLSVPIFGVARFGGVYVAVGGTAAGAAKLYTSVNGINWDEVTSAVLPASDALRGIAVDSDSNKFYVVGEAGTLLQGTFSGTSIILSNLETNLPGSPGALSAVAVLGPDHVAVGGASAYYAESFDGGATWSQGGVPGSSTIAAISGNCFRTLVGAGTKVYERSILTGDEFVAITPEGGVTIVGNITDIAMASDDFNYFAITTDTGEIFFAKPPYPNA